MPFQLSARTLALRESAYTRLNITAASVACAPQITPQLAMIEKTLKRAGQPRTIRKQTIPHPDDSTERVQREVIEESYAAAYGPGSDLRSSWPLYLSASEHSDARRVLSTFHSLPRELRRVVPIEAFCVAAAVSPISILEQLFLVCVRQGAQASSLIASINQPRVVEKSVEMALTDDGIDDRTLLARATGFLPSPSGSRTVVNVAANASAAAAAKSDAVAAPVLAPPPEQTIRRLVDRFNDAKALAEAPANNIPIPIAPVIDADYANVTVNRFDADVDEDADE